MMLIRSLLIVILLLAIAVIESLAQNSSSASQTVTFGVRRSAPVVLASAQTASVTVREIGVERSSPLKVTVGSEVESTAVPEVSYASASPLSSGSQSNFAAVKSFSTKSARAKNSVVTLTE
jgi:hypothetical protein